MLLVFLVLCGAAVAYLDGELRNQTTPEGIVAFEFCGFTSTCEQALQAWSAYQHKVLLLLLGLDYLFMLFYPATLAVAITLLRQKLDPKLPDSGRLPFALAIAIAGADAVENLGSISLALNGVTEGPALIAAVCATIKFVLLGLGCVWLLLLLGRRLVGAKAR
ncbi:MAG: hypothetical protein AAF098_02335 [Pseudomonadota bacterium]